MISSKTVLTVNQTNLNAYEIAIKMKSASKFAEITREIAKLIACWDESARHLLG